MISGDTIAAISSAVGPAARMIVRVSGPASVSIAQSLCHLHQPAAGTAERVSIVFKHLRVPATIYSFHSPRSYTGEDLVEFHIPGNPLLARMLLDEIQRLGARPAEAGEFTARAYFNGRMNLTAAEGVAAQIAAQNEQELRAARQLMSGELARRLQEPMDQLAQTLALVEVGIDFSEEDVSFLSPEQIEARIDSADAALARLIDESARFERLSHEPHVLLVGRPNAGKSTLLNALAGHERAVVSPIAGTTRDALSAEVALKRGIIRLTDVAGIASEPKAAPASAFNSSASDSPAAQIERQMRQRALRTLQSADLVLRVSDAADPRPPIELPRSADLDILTKIDLLPTSPLQTPGQISVSALRGDNLDLLALRLDELAFGPTSINATLALNARHLTALSEARAALSQSRQRVRSAGPEVVAMELREALDALGQILGSISPDDLLGKIFSAFCIGK